MSDQSRQSHRQSHGPVVIELEDDAVLSPEDAPVVVDHGPVALETAARFMARPPSRLLRWFFGVSVALVGFAVSIATWDFINGLMARHPVLGAIGAGLGALLLLVLLLLLLREMRGIRALGRLKDLQSRAREIQTSGELGAAQDFGRRLLRLYEGRDGVQWGAARYREQSADVLDADAVLGLAERELLAPLDGQAMAEIEAASRQVATVTAFVPMALADVLAALTMNLRMIWRISEIYGARSGSIGNWRLTRIVLGHLVATGAVSVGDDLIGSVMGGSVMGKISRRFGEGVINGALTARVGVAAMDVCRPVPFGHDARPKVTQLVKRALAGLFTRRKSEG